MLVLALVPELVRAAYPPPPEDEINVVGLSSDKAVILKRGQIVETGPTDEVFGNPRHPYTRDLLASVPELHRRWSEPVEAPFAEPVN